jgi:hypothetical protein
VTTANGNVPGAKTVDQIVGAKAREMALIVVLVRRHAGMDLVTNHDPRHRAGVDRPGLSAHLKKWLPIWQLRFRSCPIRMGLSRWPDKSGPHALRIRSLIWQN